MYVTGLFRKHIGKAEAVSCHKMDLIGTRIGKDGIEE